MDGFHDGWQRMGKQAINQHRNPGWQSDALLHGISNISRQEQDMGSVPAKIRLCKHNTA
jgi:hypothetical protein